MGIFDIFSGLFSKKKKKKPKKKSANPSKSKAKRVKKKTAGDQNSELSLAIDSGKKPKVRAQKSGARPEGEKPPKKKLKKRPRPDEGTPKADSPKPSPKKKVKKKKIVKKAKPGADVPNEVIKLGGDGKKKKNIKQLTKDVDIKVTKTKGRKKAAPPPVSKKKEHESGLALGFSGSDDSQTHSRAAFRVPATDIIISIDDLNDPAQKFETVDVSVTGVGFKMDKKLFKLGSVVGITFYQNGNPIITGAKVKIMRFEGGLAGCQFVDLDRVQEDDIYKLVLSKQKELSERKKGGKPPKSQPSSKTKKSDLRFDL